MSTTKPTEAQIKRDQEIRKAHATERRAMDAANKNMLRKVVK